MNRNYWRGRHIVYRLFEGDRLLYVGRSVDLVRRLTEHRSESWWFQHVTRARFQILPTAEAADDAERMAILDEAPVFNQMSTGRAWDSKHNWTPLDHQRHDDHMTRIWAAMGKPYLRSVS